MNHSINFPIFESGSVWLAGAGPGDPGLLTLHTINAMQQADIAIYDATPNKTRRAIEVLQYKITLRG